MKKEPNIEGFMTEKQYLKMMKNITEEPLRKLKEEGLKDEYEYVFKNGFMKHDSINYVLFDGLTSSGFCPCGSKIKFKHCCEQRANALVESLLKCTYAGALETTKNPEKLPIGFRLSPIFELDLKLEEKDTLLLKEIIRTHPSIVDHLYLISAKKLAEASAESSYARYFYDLIVSIMEDGPFRLHRGMEDVEKDETLNEEEKEWYVYNKTAVPSSRHKMREEQVQILSTHTFVLI